MCPAGVSHRVINISFHGLTLAAPQVLGGVRLVPVVRSDYREDLRLSKRAYANEVANVLVDRKTIYSSYIPHGLVANWTTDGSAVFGTQLEAAQSSGKDKAAATWQTAQGFARIAQREDKRQLRFLPMHLAMEGLLALHFRGPSIAWTEYARHVKRSGLGPRIETVVPGKAIVGLEDALRLFEIHQNQVGVLVFVADDLASAFVLPHPDDYIALHHTLISDFYGELIWHYGLFALQNEISPEPISIEQVESIDNLRDEISGLRRRWAELSSFMASHLFERPLNSEQVYRFRPFSLERFITQLDPRQVNFIGEAIFSDDNSLQYLKTFRLSAAQTKRAHILQKLSECHWNLEECAKAFACRTSEFKLRMENAGFGYLLHQHVLDQARSQERKL